MWLSFLTKNTFRGSCSETWIHFKATSSNEAWVKANMAAASRYLERNSLKQASIWQLDLLLYGRNIPVYSLIRNSYIRPSYLPNYLPTNKPTYQLTIHPTNCLLTYTCTKPTIEPTNYSSNQPIYHSSMKTFNQPTNQPTNHPSNQPSSYNQSIN